MDEDGHVERAQASKNGNNIGSSKSRLPGNVPISMARRPIAHAPPELLDGERGVLHGQRRHANEPVGIGRAQRGDVQPSRALRAGRLGDAGDRRAGTNEVCDVDDDVGRRIVDHRSPRRIDGENRDIQAPVFASSIRRAIVVYSMGAKPTPASAPVPGRARTPSPRARRLAVLAGDDGIAVKRAARSSPERQLRLDGRARAVSRPHSRPRARPRRCPR